MWIKEKPESRVSVNDKHWNINNEPLFSLLLQHLRTSSPNSQSTSKITEAQNEPGCKSSLRSSSATCDLTPPHRLNLGTECQVQAVLNPPGVVTGQSIPVPDHSFREEFFPDVQPKPSLVQLKAVSSCL